MKITDNRKIEKKEVAEEGDLIKVKETICLLVADSCEHNSIKLVCLNDIYLKEGISPFICTLDLKTEFEKGNYTIYAKKGTWGVLIE